jgi:threonine/homoserine/homoserine lactone efflux protein
MFQPLLEGLLSGIALSLMLGTVFFFIIQNSLDHGFKTGFLISVGVVISDLLLIALSMILMFMGYRSFTKNSSALWSPGKGESRAFFLAANGFMLNIINPANAVNWFAIALYLKDVEQYTTLQRTLFFSGALATIVLTEVGIAWGASSLKRCLSEKVLQWINRITGLIFIGFAIYLLFPLVLR